MAFEIKDSGNFFSCFGYCNSVLFIAKEIPMVRIVDCQPYLLHSKRNREAAISPDDVIDCISCGTEDRAGIYRAG